MPPQLFKVFRKKDPEVKRPSNADGNIRTIGSRSLNHGLIELYPGGKEPVLDIVFVHGLTGNAFKTWFDEKSGTHWPSDLLSKDFPDARIFTWGYDANVAGFLQQAGGSRITNHAETLVSDIVGERSSNNVKERPIIFVSHSLGGLVVANALSRP